jgi:hypothetical protein
MKKILYLMPLWTFGVASAQSQNPLAVVPPLVYQSAFADLPAFDPERPTADKQDWRKANEAVAQFPRGHMDILKKEMTEGMKGADKDAIREDKK